MIRYEIDPAAVKEMLADWPNMLKQTELVAKMRAEGRNVTFMVGVDLPVKVKDEKAG